MAYGITEKSQLIDLETIQAACNRYKEAVSDFEKCGDIVVKASEICTQKALSADDNSLQYQIEDLGMQIKELTTRFSNYADQLMVEAKQIYNAQATEYNEYLQNQANQTNN